MNFQQILEAPFKSLPYEIKGLYHDIYQRCQPYLQEVDNKPLAFPLYRGMQDKTNPGPGMGKEGGHEDVRLTDRKPTDTSLKDHAALNKFFTREYGHPFRNGLFVTGTKATADSYGKAYSIFPIGKFEYLWHPEIYDLYTEVVDPETANTYSHWEGFANAYFDPSLSSDEKWEKIENGFDAGDLLQYVTTRQFGRYKSDELKKGIKEPKTEIMIWCEDYFYLDPEYVKGFQAWIRKA